MTEHVQTRNQWWTEEATVVDDPPLTIAGKTFRSRLILGTGKYADYETMARALAASGTEMVTVAVRRIDLNDRSEKSMLAYIDRDQYHLLPNTAGCYTAKEAVLTAELAREALGTNWIKLEVIGDEKTLFPDNRELLKAAEILLNKGFIVLPYTNDDPVVCKKLQEMGCHAVMPLGAPIGSGAGIRNPWNIRIILEQATVPVIVDAGVGTASDVTIAMELGCDGVLMNTAVAQAKNPVAMAHAMRHAVVAGRLAYLAGRIPRKLYAQASSPMEGIPGVD